MQFEERAVPLAGTMREEFILSHGPSEQSERGT